nr:RDD family protein [Micromonospora sp. DSM 115978]
AGRAGARMLDADALVAVAVAVGSLTGYGPGWLVATAAGVYAYFVLATALVGTTIGKRLLNLYVVDADGQRPGLRTAAVRELFVLIGAIPFAGGPLSVLGWAAIALTARADAAGRGVHDRLAGGTRVTTG